MVQVSNTQIAQKKIDAVRVRAGKVKTPAKAPDKVVSSSSNMVQYASLPGRFKVQARGSSILLAQARKPGRSGKSTICIPGIKKTTKRRARRLTSNVKLGTSKLYYSVQLRDDGVDALIQQGSQLFRKPLDVKTKWDAKRQKVIIDGKTLKSSKLINTFSGPRLHYSDKELAKLVKPQMDALIYELNNRTRNNELSGMGRAIKTLDGGLAKLKRRLKRSFKKHRVVRATRKFLVKQHGTLKAHLISLIKERRKFARLKRKKGFTSTFRKKLTTIERQNAKLRGRIITLKSKIWALIYKYWLKGKAVRKRPCP